MPKVRKENRVLIVDEAALPNYLRQGYDQVDEETGKVIKPATGGRTVSLAEHNKALEEIESLKSQLEKAKKSGGTEELEKELESLKKEIKKLEKENKKLKAEDSGKKEGEKEGE